VTHGEKWTDQWERVGRWRERVRTSRDDFRNDGLGTEGYRDEVFALFQAVWHLKDWIPNDPNVPLTKSDVEEWLRDNAIALRIAHDVANGSKHMLLTGGGWAGGAKQTRNDVTVAIGRGVRHVFYIRDSKRDLEYEAVELADMCVREWTGFLEASGLAST